MILNQCLDQLTFQRYFYTLLNGIKYKELFRLNIRDPSKEGTVSSYHVPHRFKGQLQAHSKDLFRWSILCGKNNN